MGKKSLLSNVVLFTLEKATDTGILLYDFANNTHHYAYGQPWDIDRYALYQIVHRLRKTGLIKAEKDMDEGKLIIKLTEKGKHHLKIERILTEENWDGKWRLVIFDIPEIHKKLRNTLRQKLKNWGFKYWQKSLWVSKKDIAEPLREFIKELDLSDWVLVVVSDNIGKTYLSKN